MAGLFSKAQSAKIMAAAQKSKVELEKPKAGNPKKVAQEVEDCEAIVVEYFKDSQSLLIESKEQLHDYVTKCIEAGYAGIDTETTGLDRVHDTIVGASLYYPGGVECYIPSKHKIPIFDIPYPNQLTYEEIGAEFYRLKQAQTRLIFANADFDLAMINKDLKVDFNDNFYFDVILAWRCLKEDEKHNDLKTLYNKYVLKGKGEPMRFKDFFSPALFPYSKPQVAKLYAANDAKITYDLFKWQLPFVSEDTLKCQKRHLEQLAALVWNVEMPLVKVCQNMHRDGIFLDRDVANMLHERYHNKLKEAQDELAHLVDNAIENCDYVKASKRTFQTGKDFNPNSPIHCKYLFNTMLGLNVESTGKDAIAEINTPITNQILKIRSLNVLINTFVDKLPKATTSDSRIHAQYRQIGAGCITGDSIIPTDKGYFRIDDLCEPCKGLPSGEFADVGGIRICNKDQKLEAPSHAVRYDNMDTIKIGTEFGLTLEGTPNHPIMISKYNSRTKKYILNYHYKGEYPRIQHFWDERHFKRLDELEVGDIIEIPCNYSTVLPKDYVRTGLSLREVKQPTKKLLNAKMPQVYNENFAEFLGMWHADGSGGLREGTYTLEISNRDPDVISRVHELSKELFGTTATNWYDAHNPNEVATYINCVRLQPLDSILCKGVRNKKIPKPLWRSPVSVINSYIKGMTLDSTVYFDENNKPAFELSIIDKEDARFVQQHLLSQGIVSYFSYNVPGNREMFCALCFNSDNYAKFRDTIGFIQSRKYISGKGCGKFKKRRIGNSIWVTVKSIEKSKNTVYDFTVPETHSFISNGMISHNTGRMCIAENVPVTCLNGTKPIKDIKPGDLVYCYDDNGGIHLSPVKNVWKTGTNRDCVTIKWQSFGKGDIGYLTCTPEHRVRLKSGQWVRADSLQRYDKLAHLRRTCGRHSDRRPCLYGWNGLSTREQDVIKTDVFHADTSLSIHHKDNNPQNNDISNLEILTAAEHAKITVAQQMSSGTHTTAGMKTAAAKLKRVEVQRAAVIARHISRRAEYLEAIRLAGGRLTKVSYDYYNFKKSCSDAGIDVVHECARYNTRYAKRAFPIDIFNEAWAASSGDLDSIATRLDTSVETVMWLCKQYDACANHMVQSVEYAGKFDVYDIEVEGYHNFIAGEINVHNSSAEPRYAYWARKIKLTQGRLLRLAA